MPSIGQIPLIQAQSLFDAYCDPRSRHPWPLYDEDPCRLQLSGSDLTAPALLTYPVPSSVLVEMGRYGTSYSKLIAAMRTFVATPPSRSFAALGPSILTDLVRRKRGAEPQGPPDWQALVRCLDAVQDCATLTSVFVTKVLHRKRPDLVPINDSRVRTFYIGKSRRYDLFFRAIYHDLRRPAVQELLAAVITQRKHRTGPAPTALRALDIILWMYTG